MIIFFLFSDNCVFQSTRNTATSRSYTKLPSLRAPSRGVSFLNDARKLSGYYCIFIHSLLYKYM